MSTSRHFNKICCMVLIFALVLTVCFMNAESFGVAATLRAMGYEEKIFDPSVVHTIDITMEDWDEFIADATSESYYECDMVIDGESFKDVAIRGKGNTSLSSVKNMDSDRYSFKVEFDHYDKTASYHGLDKLCLNNTIQDRTYMKDFIAYQMMNEFGVPSPLCSFVYITVNGEDWGLYLAVEGVEDSFLQRNYGSDVGELYKPDSQSFGGGRGQGKDFRMSEFMEEMNGESGVSGNGSGAVSMDGFPEMEFPGKKDGVSGNFGRGKDFPGSMDNVSGNFGRGKDFPGSMGSVSGNSRGGREFPGGGKGGFPGGGMGSDDVKLKYTDDEAESYSNIFNSAKTEVSDADKERLIKSLKSLNEYENLEEVLNIDEVLRYFVVHNFVVNGDSYTGGMIHNYYLYEKDGKLEMIPWDYNLAYGTFQGKDAESAVNLSIDSPIVSGGFGGPESPAVDDRPMLGWVFSSEEYTELYHQYFEEFAEKLLDTGYVTNLIESTAKLIEPYVKSDPTAFYEYEDFTEGCRALKTFIELRTESVKRQLAGDTTLIDASSLNLDALGGMGDTNKGGSDGGGMPSPPDGAMGPPPGMP
ncbi:MAG: CotH kinase family protein [Lachnospiraceae bacterium]|nr:CotH kinase family protein [Lachnospiraceae bacterium]